MLNQIPLWTWALLPTVMLAVVLWRQRSAGPPAAPADPLRDLQAAMLRGLLRKEGLLPAEEPRPATPAPAVFQCPQRFQIVPLAKEQA